MKLLRFISLLAILIIARPAESAPKHWYRDLKWWAGEAVIVTVTSLDAQSTCQGFSRGGVESAAILSGNHSCGTEVGVMAGGIAFYTTLHALEWHFGHKDESKIVRDLYPWAIPAVVTAVHLPAAIHNYESTRPAVP